MASLMETLGLKTPDEPDLESLPELDSADQDKEYNNEYAKEFGEEFLEDPAPAEQAKRPGRPRGKSKSYSAPKASKSLKNEVKAELTVYAQMAAMAFAMRDPNCAMVLNAQSEAIADSITDLLARYPGVLEKFHQTGVIGDWLKVFMAVAPVMKAIWSHHIVKDVSPENESPDEYGIPDHYVPFAGFNPGQHGAATPAGAMG